MVKALCDNQTVQFSINVVSVNAVLFVIFAIGYH